MENALSPLPVIILAGGLGTRLRPALADRPKGLAPIGDRSFLEIQISLLREHGARRFVLCVGHLAPQIQQALGDGRALGVSIDYSLEEPGRLLGTGGALKLAERYFAPRALVLNGDTYFDIAYAELVAHHLAAQRQSGAWATLALAVVDQRERYGNVELDAAEQYIMAFREKDAAPAGAAGWVSGGAYVIERSLLDYVQPGQAASIEKDVFPRALADGHPLAALKSHGRFYDIGTPDAWRIFVHHYQSTHPDEH